MIDSFVPNESLAVDIQTAKPIEDYEVIHIRAGDIVAYNTAINFTVDYDYEKIIQKIVSKVNEIKSQSANAFIIMCDSDKVKKTLAKRCGLIPTVAKSVHLNIAKESDADRVKDTLVDFFLLKDAKAVHHFSVHDWGSTFSNCANWIYDTPLNQYTLLT
jgi:predicted PilT family ATPase